jgi:hypothetical protein
MKNGYNISINKSNHKPALSSERQRQWQRDPSCPEAIRQETTATEYLCKPAYKLMSCILTLESTKIIKELVINYLRWN